MFATTLFLCKFWWLESLEAEYIDAFMFYRATCITLIIMVAVTSDYSCSHYTRNDTTVFTGRRLITRLTQSFFHKLQAQIQII